MSARPTQLRHRASVGVAAVCLLGLVLTAVSATPASAGDRGPGYRIPATGKAAGGWIGARILDGTKVYRIEPAARAKTSGYRSAEVVADLDGGAGPSLTQTRRAAYILSVYGTRNDDIQAAAVDAAVLHLLAGGRWRIGRTQGARRIRAAGQSRYVRSYARTMLSRSTKASGPVSRVLTASKTTAGSASKVVLTIRSSGTGTGLGGLPVTFRYPGLTAITAYTNGDGKAVAYLTPTAPNASVTATVASVPEWRLHVREPKQRRSSAVALAGRKLALTSSARVVASGLQAVTVSNSANLTTTGQRLSGRYSINGGDGTRTVTSRAHGPFGTSTSACSGSVGYTASTSIAGTSGTWSLPAYSPTRSGYYRWSVEAGANAFSTAATGCGAPVRVRKQAAVSQFRLAGDTNDVKIDKSFRIGARVSGFDRTEAHTLTGRLYGPFANKDNADCGASRLVSSKTVTKAVSTNGDVTMPATVIGAKANAGWYIWRTTLNTGDLIIGGVSTCGVRFNVTP